MRRPPLAVFRGSTGSMTLNKPMTGMVPFGNGYPPANPIVSIAALN